MDTQVARASVLKSLAFGLAALPIAFFLATAFGFSGAPRLVATLLLVLLTGSTIRGVRNGMGYVFGRLLWPTGTAAPYAYGFSQESSLLAAGDRAGAAALLEQRIARESTDLEARWRLARLLLQDRAGDARGLALLHEITRAPGVTHDADVQATHLLVEQQLVAPGQERAAMRELARLAQRYPGSDTATFARRWLAEIKERASDA